MDDRHSVFSDLAEAGDEVDAMVARLTAAAWSTPTPAVGWSIAHQIAHLAATFRLARIAASDPGAFAATAARFSGDFDADVARALSGYVVLPPTELVSRWRGERAGAVAALAAVPAGQPVPWLVRPLPAPVLAAAGMTELFGHGQDIADALHIRPRHTDRIRHIVQFAARTWEFGYLARGLTPPELDGFGFELTAPSGEVWTLGAPDAQQWVSGPAIDLCLLVTRRRHRDDLALKATGTDADRWLDIAQAYRGPAGPGRAPGQFAETGR